MYTKTNSSIWVEMKQDGLSDRAKLLMNYLMTNDHRNVIGVYRIPYAYAASDLGWSIETVSKGFGELIDKGYIQYDDRVEMVLIYTFLEHNPLENPNVIKSAVKLVEKLPKTVLLSDFERVLKGFGERYKALYQTVSNTENRIQNTENRMQKYCTEQKNAPCQQPSEEKAQQEEPVEEVVERLPLNTGDYPITQKQLEEWERIYPAVDIPSELRKMHGWLLANPKRRKTKTGIMRFVNSWLSREQDSGRTKGKSNVQPKEDSFDMGKYVEWSLEQMGGKAD